MNIADACNEHPDGCPRWGHPGTTGEALAGMIADLQAKLERIEQERDAAIEQLGIAAKAFRALRVQAVLTDCEFLECFDWFYWWNATSNVLDEALREWEEAGSNEFPSR